MRILHLSPLYPPRIVGGCERSVEQLAEEQARMGHTVGAVSLEPEAHAPLMRNGVLVHRLAHENLFWFEDWPKHNRVERAWHKMRQQWNFRIERSFGKILDDFRPDVVNTHSLVDISTLVWRAAKTRNIPIVHTVCDYDLLCANSAMFRRGEPCDKWHLNCQVITLSKRFTTRMVDAVTFVGKVIRQTHLDHGYFAHLPAERNKVVYYSSTVVGAEVQVKGSARGGPLVFGYLGRINTEKGVGTIIDAFQELGEGPWKCLIAGKAMDDSLERFEHDARGLPIEFVGFVDPKAFFDQVDVLIVPSIWAEPSPRTIYEAYAVGIPVIGARTGGIPELIGDDNSDWLFDGGDASGLASRIRDIAGRGRDAFPDPREYQWVLDESRSPRVAQKFLALYQDVIDDRA